MNVEYVINEIDFVYGWVLYTFQCENVLSIIVAWLGRILKTILNQIKSATNSSLCAIFLNQIVIEINEFYLTRKLIGFLFCRLEKNYVDTNLYSCFLCDSLALLLIRLPIHTSHMSSWSKKKKKGEINLAGRMRGNRPGGEPKVFATPFPFCYILSFDQLIIDRRTKCVARGYWKDLWVELVSHIFSSLFVKYNLKIEGRLRRKLRWSPINSTAWNDPDGIFLPL